MTFQLTPEMLRDGEALNRAVARALRDAAARSLYEIKYGPTLGPRRVLNDAQQAEADRRQALAEIVLGLADEWDVMDLVRGDEW